MATFKTARERAEDAQSAFIAFLIAGTANREEFKALLESIFSTMQIAEKNAFGIKARTTHVAYSERPENKMFFEALEAQVWRLHAAGAAAEVIYGSVRATASKKDFDLLPFDAHLARLRAYEQRSAHSVHVR